MCLKYLERNLIPYPRAHGDLMSISLENFKASSLGQKLSPSSKIQKPFAK